jgi:anti-sigma regulatory factor (Ser/Thr protein kinase)/CheY-like chemotaxis protein
MITQTKPKILLVEPDAALRNAQGNFLSRDYDVITAVTANEALLEFQPRHFACVLCEANMALQGLGLAESIRHIDPEVPIALLAKGGAEHHFHQMRLLKIYHFLIRTAPLDYDDFGTAVENIVYPEHAFGLGRYLGEDQITSVIISSREERLHVTENVLDFISQFRAESDVPELRLAFEELVNNAVFHAFRTHHGKEKYQAGQFVAFTHGEKVMIEYGSDSKRLGFSVTDNQGTLDANTIMERMERQISLEGIMDMSGRGLYLTRSICDRMIFNLEPGRTTQVILLFDHNTLSHPKPLYINTVK